MVISVSPYWSGRGDKMMARFRRFAQAHPENLTLLTLHQFLIGFIYAVILPMWLSLTLNPGSTVIKSY